ncbi:MAG: gamma-glutamylcyclotransferase family protein [Pseudomonadota bacterium]
MNSSAQTRLATYGTLAPGQINHHQLAGLKGYWSKGFVRGTLIEEGWGAAHGCPGLVLDPNGPEVEVSIFESVDLPDHWERLDAFEGDGYQRVTVKAAVAGDSIEVSIYEVKV